MSDDFDTPFSMTNNHSCEVYVLRQKAVRQTQKHRRKWENCLEWQEAEAAWSYGRNPTAGTGAAVESICAHPVPATSMTKMLCEGVTVMEIFGGMAAGLEMVLRQGITVNRYIYCDHNPIARTIAHHRLLSLSAEYGPHFPHEAWENAFTTIPQNVFDMGIDHLRAAGATDGTQWIVFVSWNCASLTLEGSRTVYCAEKARKFFPLLQMIGELQYMQKALFPLIYIMESNSLQLFPEAEAVYKSINTAFGQPVVLDAARFGSHGHKFRNYWTNLCKPWQLQQVLDSYERDPRISIRDILRAGAEPQVCTKRYSSHAPWCEVNTQGETMKVMPTLEASRYSCMRGKGPGLLIHSVNGQKIPLSTHERERASGYQVDSTAAQGVTEHDRKDILGTSSDAFALGALMSTAIAIRLKDSPLPDIAQTHYTAAVTELGGGGHRG
jgi:hypothetical protein